MNRDPVANSTMATLLAANQVSRRTVLNGIVAAGATALASPLFIRGARASSGQVNVLGWAEELPDSVTKKFTAATGIEIKITPFSSRLPSFHSLHYGRQDIVDGDLVWVDRRQYPKILELRSPIDRGLA